MSAERRITAFFDLADRGLKSAEVLFHDGQFEDSAYFAQQIVERVARALLTKAGVPFGTSHNLGRWLARFLLNIRSEVGSTVLTGFRLRRRNIAIPQHPDGCLRLPTLQACAKSWTNWPLW
jgi:HEPN domain-containing protein